MRYPYNARGGALILKIYTGEGSTPLLYDVVNRVDRKGWEYLFGLNWSDLIWINKSIEDDVVLDSAIWWKHKLYSFGLPTTSFSFPFLRIPLFCWSTEDDNGEGGEGGALYTGVDSTTLFQRRTVMQHNEARSGGAIYNLGYTEIESRGFMRANQALVSRHLLAA